MRDLTSVCLILIVFALYACGNDDIKIEGSSEFHPISISAVDISRYPEIRQSGTQFYDRSGNRQDLLQILKDAGINTIRLRLWVNPATAHSGFEEVKAFAAEIRGLGMKVWLSVHYSDTWADPGNQETPESWKALDFDTLLDTVSSYTSRVVTEIDPDLIQVGNETNTGFLYPFGNISDNPGQYHDLVETAIRAIRDNSSKAKIIIHHAGHTNAEQLLNTVSDLDFDMVGLSYYPIWHGKEIFQLQGRIRELGQTYNKEVIIAETSYPFTKEWNDWTHNIVGLDEQLILPDYPATPEGQEKFVKAIRTLLDGVESGVGLCYWGAELVAWKGNEAEDASPWENQALFDFTNKALPALDALSIEQ